MVSYSRSRVPAGGPPLVCVSVCCIAPPLGFAASRAARGTSVCFLIRGPATPAPRTPAGRRRGPTRPVVGPFGRLVGTSRTAVELVHGRARTFQESGHRGFGSLGDELAELRLLLGRELRQHPVRAFPERRGLADAEPDPQIAVAQMLVEAAQPVVTRRAASDLHLDAAEREIELVVGDDDRGRVRLPEARGLRHRLAARVHERLREDDGEMLAPRAPRAQHGVPALLIERDAELARGFRGDAEADVVPGTFVLVARVPEADEKPHGGYFLPFSGPLAGPAAGAGAPAAAGAPGAPGAAGAEPGAAVAGTAASPVPGTAAAGAATTSSFSGTATTAMVAFLMTLVLNFTPGGTFTSEMWRDSAILRFETSTSIFSGIWSGLHWTGRVRLTCWRMPPSVTPIGLPTRITGTLTTTSWSMRTSRKSACSMWPSTGSRS